jgi:phage head maturation protease
MSELLQTRALFAPDTIDAEARTVEVVWTTGARVPRRDFDGPYMQELSMEPGAIRMDRLNSGAPLLNNHQATELRDIVGVVERASYNKEEGRAVVRFSSREDVEPIFRDVRDGIIRSISVGYRVWKYERIEEGDTTVMRAVDWEPHELSLVPIPADSRAQVRSEEPPTVHNEPAKDSPMEDNRELEGAATLEAPVAQERAARPEDIQAAIAAERRRVAEIRRSVRAAGLDGTLADQLEQDGTSIDEARKLIIDKMADREDQQPTRTHVQVTADHAEKRRECMSAALEARVGLRQWDDQAREYLATSMLEMGREVLRAHGVNTTGMSKSELASRAMHSTSDFPILLSNIARKTLMGAYAEEQQTFRPLVRSRNLPDFKPTTEVEIAGQIIPELLLEGGEYKAATVQEQDMSWRIFTYGKKITFTRQLLINDDLDALSRVPMMIGRGMSLFESNEVWRLITANAKMPQDGKTLFHNDHANQGTGAIGEQSISDARKALRNQKDIAGNRVNLRPRFLLLPTSLETAAQKFLAPIQPTETPNVNIFSGSLKMIVEPRLDDDSEQKFYVTADPSQIDMIAVGYLEGEVGPQVDTFQDRDPDGITMLARLDFGTTLLNYRGFYKSTGV